MCYKRLFHFSKPSRNWTWTVAPFYGTLHSYWCFNYGNILNAFTPPSMSSSNCSSLFLYRQAIKISANIRDGHLFGIRDWTCQTSGIDERWNMVRLVRRWKFQTIPMTVLYVAYFLIDLSVLEMMCFTTMGHYFTQTWRREKRTENCMMMVSCPLLKMQFYMDVYSSGDDSKSHRKAEKYTDSNGPFLLHAVY